jgi:hypothetical protein
VENGGPNKSRREEGYNGAPTTGRNTGRLRGFVMKWKEEHYSRYQQESYALPGQELEAIWHYVRQRKHLKYDTDHDENAKRISKKE